MGKGKGLNPADKARKKEKEREKKRNREEKTMTKEIATLNDPEAILNELKEIAKREAQGYVDHVQSKRKRTLMEWHKKVTQRVKHEEKKSHKETPYVPAAAVASAPAATVLGGARPAVAFDFGAVMAAPPPPAAARGDVGGGKGEFSDYQQSVHRLRMAEKEEEHERAFQGLLEAQLAAAEDARRVASLPAPPVPYAATLEPLRPQKPLLSSATGGAVKRKKIVETDALGCVVAEAPRKAPPAVVAASFAPDTKRAKSGALGMLGGYGEKQDDPYDALMAELSKVL